MPGCHGERAAADLKGPGSEAWRASRWWPWPSSAGWLALLSLAVAATRDPAMEQQGDGGFLAGLAWSPRARATRVSKCGVVSRDVIGALDDGLRRLTGRSARCPDGLICLAVPSPSTVPPVVPSPLFLQRTEATVLRSWHVATTPSSTPTTPYDAVKAAWGRRWQPPERRCCWVTDLRPHQVRQRRQRRPRRRSSRSAEMSVWSCCSGAVGRGATGRLVAREIMQWRGYRTVSFLAMVVASWLPLSFGLFASLYLRRNPPPLPEAATHFHATPFADRPLGYPAGRSRCRCCGRRSCRAASWCCCSSRPVLDAVGHRRRQ